MSSPIHINSPEQFTSLLSSTKIVVVDFFAEWCGPCKQIAPVYEQLAMQLSKPKEMVFTKVDTDKQPQISQSYNITAMPTFMVFKNGKEVSRIRGANPKALSDAVKKLAVESESGGSSSGGFGESSSAAGGWIGMGLPKAYTNCTEHVDIKGLDLLNADSDFGGVRTLFEPSAPSSLDSKGKSKGAATTTKDWVESDTDPQLMFFIPFQATLKVHTIHVTSLPPKSSEGDDDDEVPMRPKTIHLYTNRAHNLGFEEAEDITPTQKIELEEKDWDENTGTAKIEVRFVKFQNVSSLVMFVVDGDGDGERTRIDRLRIVGESGEKRSMGKLEKIGDEQGE
ncbi:putative thioredoxin [Aulographum hederae CBS 113979]|uniref:Putative thioredoxin n=1 Tax=Aulographum hederae CBS 113979 TaxID=1176131 RepID=A0A6G1GUD7_9PEZI|nr:putative thioredoxin [Aulographum hederae CBS 113979]